MPRSKKTSSGGTGATGGTTQECVQEGTLIVIANLVSGAPRPFKDGLDVAVKKSVSSPGEAGKSGKTNAEGVKEFPKLPANLYTVSASLSGGNTAKFELLGNTRTSTSVPAGGSTLVNFDVTPLLALNVRVKVKASAPPVFLKPERVTLKDAKGRFETSQTPAGVWQFKKLHPGRITIEVKLTAADAERHQLVETTTSHVLTETPQPNVVDVEVQRIPVLVPLHFAFRFLDPEGKPRVLPGALPVKVLLSERVPAKPGDAPPGPDTFDAQINENGVLVPVSGPLPFKVPRAFKKLTLDFTQQDATFIICEAPNAPPVGAAVKYVKGAEFSQKLRAGRGFMLPWKRAFTLDTADWEIKDGAADGKPVLAQLADENRPFGTPAQMMVFTLKPRWQFARFTFFDRFFGYAAHDKKQVSIPPVNLRGMRTLAAKAEVKEAEDAARAAAAASETERTAFEALAVAQDDRDAAYAKTSFPIYLKNWYDANPGSARPATVNPNAAAATTRRTAVDGAVATAQTAYDQAHNAAVTARATASTKLTAATTAWSKDVATTVSNWVVLPDADDRKTVQCLPWILNKKPDGKPDGGLDAEVVLEFFTAKSTYIESRSATERRQSVIPDGDARLQTGPQRLKVYDLPRTWRSRGYFARLGAKANRFEQLADQASSVAAPFTFSLDDLVLCQSVPTGGAIGVKVAPLDDKHWNPAKRCAVFHHRFKDKAVDGGALANVSKTGLYRPDTGGNVSYQSEVPSGTAAGTAGDTTVEKDRNYIADYPDWTRLVIALGNVFDVFDQRSPASPIGVSGARAAVCWHDATAARPGGSMVYHRMMPNESDASTSQEIPCTNQLPTPGKFFAAGSRPSDFGHQFLRIQPLMEFNYGVRYREKFNPANSDGTGRIDFVLVRCCGVLGSGADQREHAVNLHYTRNFFQFVPNAATALAPSGLAEAAWKDTWARNVMNRWNGDDIENPHRARLLPVSRSDGAAAPKLECDVIWFMQFVDRVRAHFLVHVENKGAGARDNRGGFDGSGESSPTGHQDTSGTWFPSAHESGHADGLADEYNEKWWSGSLGEMSYKSNLPGDPFSIDNGVGTGGSPMMNGNHIIRNRFYWPSAEWVRRQIGPPGVTLQMKVDHTSKGGVRYDNYRVVPHPTDRRTFAYWPLRSEIDQTLPGVRGMRNLYLYPLGAEQWSVRDIFARHAAPAPPNPAEPYDGILVITLHLEMDISRWNSGTPPAVDWGATNKNRRTILQSIQREVDTRANFRFKLTGQVTDAANPWVFKRCLVHFSPRFLDADYHAHTPVAGTVDDPIDPSVDGVRTQRGTHFVVKVSHHPTNPADCSWLDNSTVKVSANLGSNAGIGSVAGQFIRAFGQMLGVNKAVGSITGPDLLPLVSNLNLQNAQISTV